MLYLLVFVQQMWCRPKPGSECMKLPQLNNLQFGVLHFYSLNFTVYRKQQDGASDADLGILPRYKYTQSSETGEKSADEGVMVPILNNNGTSTGERILLREDAVNLPFIFRNQSFSPYQVLIVGYPSHFQLIFCRNVAFVSQHMKMVRSYLHFHAIITSILHALSSGFGSMQPVRFASTTFSRALKLHEYLNLH